MVDVVASRIAGLKLFGIVFLLIIPILLLSYLMIGSTRRDIQYTQMELDGVEQVALLYPVLHGAATDSLDPKKALVLGQQISAAITSKADEIQKQKRELLKLLKNPSANNNAIVESVVELMHHLGPDSRLILDPYAETYFLAQLALYNLPSVVQNYHAAYRQLDESMAFAGVDARELKIFISKMGQTAFTLQQSKDALAHILDVSQSPESYALAVALIDSIQIEVEATKDIALNAKVGTETAALMALAYRSINTSAKFPKVEKVWQSTIANLNAALGQRISELRQQFYALIAVAVACTIFATGAAYSLFRSTLRKLDIVELARQEAENMSTNLNMMNDEMVKLNRELSENMNKLNDAQNDLVKKGRMEQLGQLTATIAHELRNPLGAVRTSTFLLQRRLKGTELDVERQFERINNGIVRCDNIITQLLDYSRTKQLSLKESNLDNWLVGVVEEVAKTLPPTIEVECVLGLGEQLVPFDTSRLERAVINLMNNASEAMVGKGNFAVQSNKPNSKILISTKLLNGNVHLAFTDNGPGIEPENLQRIREPLFTTKSFGTGLGIPAIEQIVVQHSGELTIESRIGVGSVFTMIIPLATNDVLGSRAA